MTPTQQKAVQMALEALEIGWDYRYTGKDARQLGERAIQALRAALAEQADGKAEGEQLAWTPTPKNINALPEPVREYIHNLEANADPAGTVRGLAIARDTIRALEASNRMLRDDKVDVELDKDVKKNRLIGAIDDLIAVDPDRAERVIESILARHNLKKRVAARSKP